MQKLGGIKNQQELCSSFFSICYKAKGEKTGKEGETFFLINLFLLR